MDVANFATKFSLERSGLLQLIRDDLLEGEGATIGINAELHKLNVYGNKVILCIFVAAADKDSCCFVFRKRLILQVTSRYSSKR
jgi:hypothetical protein